MCVCVCVCVCARARARVYGFEENEKNNEEVEGLRFDKH